jgi:DNA polymerase III epsilon subunit-like protein
MNPGQAPMQTRIAISFLDTETTGLDTQRDEIVEICVVTYIVVLPVEDTSQDESDCVSAGFRFVLDEFQSFAVPTVPINKEASKVNKITKESLKLNKAPPLATMLQNLQDHMDALAKKTAFFGVDAHYCVTHYGSGFDMPLLFANLEACKLAPSLPGITSYVDTYLYFQKEKQATLEKTGVRISIGLAAIYKREIAPDRIRENAKKGNAHEAGFDVLMLSEISFKVMDRDTEGLLRCTF